jgi:hypothetical protein
VNTARPHWLAAAAVRGVLKVKAGSYVGSQTAPLLQSDDELHVQLPRTSPEHVLLPVEQPLLAEHVAIPHVPAVLAVQDPAPEGQSVVSPQLH